MSSAKLILTCEHGGNQIPKEYNHLFEHAASDLKSHKGYDIGALEVFKVLRNQDYCAYSNFSVISRLLIELNRSLHHPSLFSKYTKHLDAKTKAIIIASFYEPYRKSVEEKIESMIQDNFSVIHISVHSFTPILNGEKRNADVGLLYDPHRVLEKRICYSWKAQLQHLAPNLNIRMNYPYKGTADGFVTFLRKKYKQYYCGIELEMNQSHFSTGENGLITIISNSLNNLTPLLGE